MMILSSKQIVNGFTLLAVGAAASAQPIQFTTTGRGTGSINGVPFGPADFVITATADMANVQQGSSAAVNFIPHDFARIAIDGVGEFDFISPTRTFVNRTAQLVGFSRTGASSADLYNGPNSPQFAMWFMQSYIGPVSGECRIIQWNPPHPPVQTTGGQLLFVNEVGIPCIFTASDVMPICYANCDGSTTQPILTVDDFTCFINEFAAAQSLPHEQQISHYANCDGSTTAPALTVDDFTCFINAFAAGCP